MQIFRGSWWILVVFALIGCKQTPKLDLSKAKPLHLDKGIGPVKSLSLGKLDNALATKGAALFKKHCASCHQMNKPSIGPPLGKVANERTPEWVMNMILNPLGMVTGNPNAYKLRQNWSVMMPMLGLKQTQARALLEYLRQQAPKKKPRKSTSRPTPSRPVKAPKTRDNRK